MFTIPVDVIQLKSGPLYLRIYEFLKKEIELGNIGEGTPLPSYRTLSDHLKVSKNTIELAYQQLISEGYIESVPRKRLRVAKISPTFSHGAISLTDTSVLNKVHEADKIIDFHYGKIDPSLFPLTIWKKYTLQTLHEFDELLAIKGNPQGEWGLRREICKYLFESRGVQCSPEQIIIGASTQYLIYILHILLKEKRYGVENPGYDQITRIIEDLGGEVVPISIDDKGLSIDELNKSTVNIVYTTPSHQFPMGMVMPIGRRLELLEWANREGTYVIEDDYDSEFRYIGRPIPSLHSLDSGNRVIYFGTFSKSLLPSIRISYMVLPMDLLHRFTEKDDTYSQTVSSLHQKTVELFMKNGHWHRHLNKMRTLYKKKHDLMIEQIHTHFGKEVEILGSNSGLHIVLKMSGLDKCRQDEFIQLSLEKGVKIYDISSFYIHKMKNSATDYPMFLLGYGGLTSEEIQLGMGLLKDTLIQIQSTSQTNV